MDSSETPSSIPKGSRILQRRKVEEWTFEYTNDNKEKKYDTVTVDTMDTLDGRGKKVNTKITRKTFNSLPQAIGSLELEPDLGQKFVERAPDQEKKAPEMVPEEVTDKHGKSPSKGQRGNRPGHETKSFNPAEKRMRKPPISEEEGEATPDGNNIRNNARHVPVETRQVPKRMVRSGLAHPLPTLPDDSEGESSDINPLLLREKMKTPSETHGISLKEWRRNSTDLDQIVEGIQKRAPLVPQAIESERSEIPTKTPLEVSGESLNIQPGSQRKFPPQRQNTTRQPERSQQEDSHRKLSRPDEYPPVVADWPIQGIARIPSKQVDRLRRNPKVEASKVVKEPPSQISSEERPKIAENKNGIFPYQERKSRSGSRSPSVREKRGMWRDSQNIRQDLSPSESRRKHSEARQSTAVPDHSLVLDELRRLESSPSPEDTESDLELPSNRRSSRPRSKSALEQEGHEPRKRSAPARPYQDYEPALLTKKNSDTLQKIESEAEGSDYSEGDEESITSQEDALGLNHEDEPQSSEDESTDAAPPLPLEFLKQLQERAKEARALRDDSDISSEEAREPTRRRSSLPNPDFAREVLDAHNSFREMHGVKPFILSSELSRFSQSWAETIAKKNELIHSTGSGYGENIYFKSKGSISGSEPVNSWYSENDLYTYGSNYFNPATGHFTQLIWKGSKVIGVGVATNPRGASYVVVNYYPPGNIQTKFKSNVFPPKMNDYYS